MSALEEYLELVRAATAEIESLRSRLAEADKVNQLLRADLAAAAREEDLILIALRLDPERYRTECGYLNVPKIVAAIKNPDIYPHAADSASAVPHWYCAECRGQAMTSDGPIIHAATCNRR